MDKKATEVTTDGRIDSIVETENEEDIEAERMEEV